MDRLRPITHCDRIETVVTDRTNSMRDDIPVRRWESDGWTCSTDPALVEIDTVRRYLAAGSQSPGIPRETVARFVANSVNFALYPGAPEDGHPMVGYARVVTDFAAFAYLGDVFLLEPHRGRRRGTFLMDCVMGHPDLQGLRRWMLMCGERPMPLYARYGFVEPERPGYCMHRTDRQIYMRAAEAGEGAS